MFEPDCEDHTAVLKGSREEAERAAQALKDLGWDVYPEKVPLTGQWGYYCVSTWQAPGGTLRKRAQSVRWNLFGHELCPVVIDCTCETDIFSFVWQHGTHDNFDYFEYGDGDVGFVCYCRGHLGRSLVMHIGQELDPELSDAAFELMWIYENDNVIEDDDYDSDD